MTDDVLDYAARCVLCWLATVDGDGWPNVSPKEGFTTRGRHHLLIANIASPNSVANIWADPRVCASFVDVCVQRGFRIHGVAELLVASQADFADTVAPLTARIGDAFRLRTVIRVTVQRVNAIIAPSYRFVAHISEQSQRASDVGLWRAAGAQRIA